MDRRGVRDVIVGSLGSVFAAFSLLMCASTALLLVGALTREDSEPLWRVFVETLLYAAFFTGVVGVYAIVPVAILGAIVGYFCTSWLRTRWRRIFLIAIPLACGIGAAIPLLD